MKFFAAKIFLTFILAGSVFADAKDLAEEEIEKLLESGNFSKALLKAPAISNRHSQYYLEGRALLGLERYSEAKERFKLALEQREKRDSGRIKAYPLHYYYALALYSLSALEPARKAFLTSAKNDERKFDSLYYAAYISQILEEFGRAKKYYALILKSSDTRLKQIAHFQMGEIYLEVIEKQKLDAKAIEKHVLKAFDRAVALDPSSLIASDIKRRKDEVLLKYELHPDYFLEGTPIPPNKFSASFSQRAVHDSNITFASEQADFLPTQREAFVFDTRASIAYQKSFFRRFLLRPSLSFLLKKHSDQVSPSVFQNDAYQIGGGVSISYFTRLFTKKLRILPSFHHTYRAQETILKTGKEFFFRSNSYGTSAQYFLTPRAPLSLSYSYLNLENANPLSSFELKSISLVQVYRLQNSLYSFFGGISYADTSLKENPSLDSKSLSLSAGLTLPELAAGIQAKLILIFSLADYFNNLVRRTERTLAPKISISKRVSSLLSLEAEYGHRLRSSGDPNFDYQQHSAGIGIKVDY